MSRLDTDLENSNDATFYQIQEEANVQISKIEPQAVLLVTHFSNNQKVLGCTCLLFFLFCVAAFAGAIIGNSLSLLGDASAMLVDVFTYISNMWAEHIKSKGEKLSYRTKLIIEIIAPSFSVTALLSVTLWIFTDAVKTIQHPIPQQAGDVNVIILWSFASVNMVIDTVSFFMFYQKREDVFVEQETHLLGPSAERSTANAVLALDDCQHVIIDTIPSVSPSSSSPHYHHHHHSLNNIDISSTSNDHTTTGYHTNSIISNTNGNTSTSSAGLDHEQGGVRGGAAASSTIEDGRGSGVLNGQQQQQLQQQEEVKNDEAYPITPTRINMNMASAFTHVGADTLRTLAVFVAAAISTATNADSTLCDAWAAIVVSITIVFAVIPLVHEIYRTILHHLDPKSIHHHSHSNHADAAADRISNSNNCSVSAS